VILKSFIEFPSDRDLSASLRGGAFTRDPARVMSSLFADVRRFRVFLLPSKRRDSMRQLSLVILLAVIAVMLVGGTGVERSVAAQSSRGSSLTAVPGAMGSLDPTGPYEVVQGWPKDLSTLPGNERWTFGAGQGVFAESPDRVFYIQRGQLPVLPQGGGRRGNPLPRSGRT
jgi:hypothetical protein